MKNIAEYILDIVHNRIRAKTTLMEIYLHQSEKENLLELVIRDNGSGMDKKTADKVTNPCETSGKDRNVGLGIPLLKQNAEQANGTFSIASGKEKGTILTATFQNDHLEAPPAGDIINTILLSAFSLEIPQQISFLPAFQIQANRCSTPGK